MLSAILFATSVIVSPTCQWDSPGVNRFTGDVAASVHHYLDIPADKRYKLEKRLNDKKYDEIVDITVDKISSNKNEYVDLRDMHFGINHICVTVNRDKWGHSIKERGLIYCEDEHCILVPTVCGNVSRVTRVKNTGTITPSNISSSYIDDSNNGVVDLPLPDDTFHHASASEYEYIVNRPTYIPVYSFYNYNISQEYCCCIPVILPPAPEVPSIVMMILGISVISMLIKNK